jgi:hypothetical protein
MTRPHTQIHGRVEQLLGDRVPLVVAAIALRGLGIT